MAANRAVNDRIRQRLGERRRGSVNSHCSGARCAQLVERKSYFRGAQWGPFFLGIPRHRNLSYSNACCNRVSKREKENLEAEMIPRARVFDDDSAG